MSYLKHLQQYTMASLLCLGLTGCDELLGDLAPSNEDKRETIITGTIGNLPGQLAADFTVSDSLNNNFVLSEHLNGGSDPADITVLYFTMWCTVCLAHSDHIYNQVMPQFSNRGTVVYGLVDYVSGSVAATRAAELANGYAGSDFTTLADSTQQLMKQFNGSMGIVVVINNDGTILLKEDYRNGSALTQILDQYLP